MNIKTLKQAIKRPQGLIRTIVMASVAGAVFIATSPALERLHSAPIEQKSHIEASVAQGQFLVQRVTVVASDPLRPDVGSNTWVVDLQAHPDLIATADEWMTTGHSINIAKLTNKIALQEFEGLRVLGDVTISGQVQDGKVMRAITNGIAREGFTYDASALAIQIADAFESGTATLQMTVPYKAPSVVVEREAGTLLPLTLLATGRSNYSDSPEERVWNIHKAINERVNNIIVPMGGTFSFVDALDPPVTVKKGWKEGLGLFGGGAAFTPGAGICQAATTVYRAALLAGLPIVEKKNHSSWVDHYEPFGVGLDATVFPGFHDMRFKNDTDGPLLIQSYIIGEDVFVNMFGVADGRKSVLTGPYFYNTPNRPASLRSLAREEIGWMRTVTKSNGAAHAEQIVSDYYKGYPRVLREKYAGLPGEALLKGTASASFSL